MVDEQTLPRKLDFVDHCGCIVSIYLFVQSPFCHYGAVRPLFGNGRGRILGMAAAVCATKDGFGLILLPLPQQ
jgi:hypothetical protein